MTHEEIKILISAYFDGEVTPSEKNIVEEHLSSCASCQKDYKMYMAMSSSLSKWSDETLSPDEEIKLQRSIQKRREPMFTTRNMMALGTTLALTIIIGSVVQHYSLRGLQARIHDASIIMGEQGRLKSAADDIGSQYSSGLSNGNVFGIRKSVQYQPYYRQNSYEIKEADLASSSRARSGGLMAFSGALSMDKNLGTGLVGGQDSALMQAVPATAGNQIFPGFVQQASNIDRKVIKNADITLKVADAQNTQMELEGLVAKFNGVVVNFNINQLEDSSRRGFMVFTVFPDDLDNVLAQIRRLGEVHSENQTGSDITNQYVFVQDRLKNFKEQRDRLKKVLVKNSNNVDNNLNLEGQITNAEENINALESSLKQLDQQSYRATVSVNFYDIVKPVVIKEPGFKDKIFATIKNNLKNTLQVSCEVGINTVSGILILLSFLFPVILWSLLFWGIYLVVRRLFKK